ncbi:MAG: hypothetical protein NT027_16390, partial [Proteobacteria bacterium]|nr:hypothetical protein [Pseudomonadota bacterium]
IAIRDAVPSEVNLLLSVLIGEKPRFHEGYYQTVLKNFGSNRLLISKEVSFKYETTEIVEKGRDTLIKTDVYRAIQIGSRFYVFKVVKGIEINKSSENGPWWYPYKSYPNSLLPNGTFEARIEHVLRTEIYDKIETGRKLAALDGIEIVLGLLPAYAGAKAIFYEEKKFMGSVMVFGDVASLGMASKVKAIATASSMVVITTSSVRVINGVHEIATNKGGIGSGVDIALASIEGAFAVAGLSNVKFSLPKKINNTQELVDNIGSGRVYLVDDASASSIAHKIGKNADEIKKSGLDSNDIEKLTGVKKTSSAAPGNVLPRGDIEKQLDQVYQLAPAAKQEIDGIADDLVSQVGGRVAKAPLKGRERALEKVMNEYNGDVTRLKDLARNTVVIEENQMQKAISIIENRGAKVKVIDGNIDPLGYSGVNTSMVTKSGLTGEIQINTPQMIFGKESPQVAKSILGDDLYNNLASKAGVPGGKGHDFYEKWRSLPPDSPLRKGIETESKAYYETIRRNAN